jgi:hypothetical protein
MGFSSGQMMADSMGVTMRLPALFVFGSLVLSVCLGCDRSGTQENRPDDEVQPNKAPHQRAKSDVAPATGVPETPLKLGKIPDLHLAPRPPVTEAQAKRIKNLIAGLAALDKPDFGLSTTLSGEDFAPVPG